MAAWSLRLLYLNYYTTWEGGGFPSTIQTNEGNYYRLIIIDKSKMAASNMAGWTSKLLYLRYYSTQKGDVLGFMVQYTQWIQLNYHLLFF